VRILVIANVVPLPAYSGFRLRILDLTRRIAERHEVVLACHAWDEAEDEGARALDAEGIRTVTARLYRRPAARLIPRMLRNALSGRPPQLARWWCPELAEKIRGLLREKPFDLIQIEETTLTPYLDVVRAETDAPCVLMLHNVAFDQTRRIADITRTAPLRAWLRANAAWLRRYEPRVAGRFDRVVAVSEPDRALLTAIAPKLRVDVIANGVDTKALTPLTPAAGPPALLFVGHMGYAPCEDAAEILVRDVLPRVRARVPEAEVWIVGQEPTSRVRALEGRGVFVTGEVPDVRPFYSRAAVCAIPLRAGGGSRLKILEAMALGRPVVSTRLGAEGLALKDGEHLLLADDPAAMAAAVVQLLGDPARAARLVSAARQLVEAEHDWNLLAARQLALYGELVRDV